MTAPASIFLPAFGKIIELGTLDNFMWATLKGWGSLVNVKHAREVFRNITEGADPAVEARELERRLKEEEDDLKLIHFTDEQAKEDYPYLMNLVCVRLWAIAEAGIREVVISALKEPNGPPDRSKLDKLKGPIAQFMGADADTQAELLADLIWQAPEGRFRGVQRFEAVLELLGLGGAVPAEVSEVLTELSEVRHCVVHRGGFLDRRFLHGCPWVQIPVGSRLPVSLQRYWFYRTAVYWYALELVRRWGRWKGVAGIVAMADGLDSVVLGELTPAWGSEKRLQLKPIPEG